MDSILAPHHPELQRLDVLAIDVEGGEIKVLDGFSIEKYAPKVIVLENFFSDPAYEEKMKSCGFALWRRLAPNEIYIRTAAGTVT